MYCTHNYKLWGMYLALTPCTPPPCIEPSLHCSLLIQHFRGTHIKGKWLLHLLYIVSPGAHNYEERMNLCEHTDLVSNDSVCDGHLLLHFVSLLPLLLTRQPTHNPRVEIGRHTTKPTARRWSNNNGSGTCTSNTIHLRQKLKGEVHNELRQVEVSQYMK